MRGLYADDPPAQQPAQGAGHEIGIGQAWKADTNAAALVD